MLIQFFVNNSEKNKIGKSLTAVIDLNGNLKEDTDIIAPTISIQNFNAFNANYCYIPSFKRYYFITDFTAVTGGYFDISMRVDVLETYKNEIKAQKAILNRQENEFNTYLNDDRLLTFNNRKYQIKEFPLGFAETATINVLMVAGG